MTTKTFTYQDNVGMLLRLLGGRYMVKNGEQVTLTEAEQQDAGVRSLIRDGSLTEVVEQAKAVETPVVAETPAPKARKAKVEVAAAPVAEVDTSVSAE